LKQEDEAAALAMKNAEDEAAAVALAFA